MDDFKLNPDSIVEAIFELRFEQEEDYEIFLGLASRQISLANKFNRKRLENADIPYAIRNSDERFKFLPVFEFFNETEDQFLRVGANVASFHIKGLGNYPGGEEFLKICNTLIRDLFEICKDHINVIRLGLRFTNLLTEIDHGIKSVSDLNVSIRASGEQIDDNLSLNYLVKHSSSHQSVVRVATPLFVQGKSLPENFTALIDIDVSEPKEHEIYSDKDVIEWLSKARRFKNQDFVKLLGDDNFNRLKGE